MTDEDFYGLKNGDVIKIIDCTPHPYVVNEIFEFDSFDVDVFSGFILTKPTDVSKKTWANKFPPGTTFMSFIFEQSEIELLYKISDTGTKSQISCECGAHKLGFADYTHGHSSWCPVSEM